MYFTWLLGNNNKSIFLYEEALKISKKSPLKPIWIIVPDQFTLQAQKEIIKLNRARGILNIEILSFNRLTYRLGANKMQASRPNLSPMGKTAIISHIIKDNPDKLAFMNKSMNKYSYMTELSKMIDECYQYKISPDMVQSYSENLNNFTSKNKLKELAILLELYDDLVATKYILPELSLSNLPNLISNNDSLSNIIIMIDSFYDFLPIQLNIIEALIRKVEKVYISLPYYQEDFNKLTSEPAGLDQVNLKIFKHKSPSDLYYQSYLNITAIRKILDANAIDENFLIVKDDMSSNSDLNRLKNSILNSNESLYVAANKASQESCDNSLVLYEALNLLDEVKYVGAEIADLITNKNYTFNDIAILCAGLDDYSKSIEKIFDQFGFSYFISKKNTVSHHPFSVFLASLFKTVKYNFAIEDFILHMKSTYFLKSLEKKLIKSGLEKPQAELYINKFEIFCKERGIRGQYRLEKLLKDKLDPKIWLNFNPFEGLEDIPSSDKPDILEIILSDILNFASIFKTLSNFNDMNMALEKYFLDMSIEATTKSLIEDFERKSMYDKASIYSQAYQKGLELISEISLIFKDTPTSLDDFIDIIMAAWQEIELATTPYSLDQIQIGDLESTRISPKKVLFILGLGEGRAPKVYRGADFLSMDERNILINMGLHMAPTSKDSLYRARLAIYLNMTKASQILYMGYFRNDVSAGSIFACSIFQEVSRLFPNNQVVSTRTKKNIVDDISFPLPTFLSWIDRYMESDFSDDFIEVYHLLMSDKKISKNITNALKGTIYKNQAIRLYPRFTKKLYEKNSSVSVSRLEKFASCPFSHFVNYGLMASEISEFEITPLDVGAFLHKTIEAYMTSLSQAQIDISDKLDEDTRTNYLKQAVDKGLESTNKELFYDSARNKYYVKKLTNIADRVLWGIGKQLAVSKFKPKYFEYKFEGGKNSKSLLINVENNKISLKGVIDRVDSCQIGSTIYYSIIDYKSADKSLDQILLNEGISIQLFVYAIAMKDIMPKDSVLAGLSYFHLTSPIYTVQNIQEFENLTDDEKKSLIEREILKSLRTKGIFNSDPQVIYLYDENIMENGKSDVISASFNKDGSLSARNKDYCKQDELNKIIEKVEEKIKEITRDIFDGKTDISPYKYKNQMPCDYCPYKSICRLDENEFDKVRYLD